MDWLSLATQGETLPGGWTYSSAVSAVSHRLLAEAPSTETPPVTPIRDAAPGPCPGLVLEYMLHLPVASVPSQQAPFPWLSVPEHWNDTPSVCLGMFVPPCATPVLG